ncbi:SRPBCC family protein [Geodermatophilus sp. SYSU D01045]
MAAELRTSVDIDATPERVWRVLTDLPAYAEWNPFVTAADGDVVAGGRLSVRVPPGNALLRSHLRPTVRQVVPLRRLRVWSRLDRLGVPGLFDVEHTVTLTDHDGGVRLWQQDRFGGLLAPLLVRSLNRHRLAAFHAMGAALKQRAEGPAPVAEDRPVSPRR